jgi:hypothetical protein
MARLKNSPDVAPMIRAAFKRACIALEQGGTPLSTLMIDSLKSDFTGTLRAVSSFTPKELEIVTVSTNVAEMNADQLEQLTSLALTIVGAGREAETGSGTELTDSLH